MPTCSPAANPTCIAQIFMIFHAFQLPQRHPLLGGGICCCIEQIFRMLPRNFKIVLWVYQCQIDIFTFEDKICQSLIRLPSFLNSFRKERLENGIWSQRREYWDKPPNRIGQYQGRYICKSRYQDHPGKLHLHVYHEVLSHSRGDSGP